jgi:hypothetical protein
MRYKDDDRRRDGRDRRKKRSRSRQRDDSSDLFTSSSEERKKDKQNDYKRSRRKSTSHEPDVTDGYRLYKEMKIKKKLEEQKKAAALLEGIDKAVETTDGLTKIRKMELKDFPNYKRKLVV